MVGNWFDQQLSQTVYGLRVFRNTTAGVGNISFALASYATTFQVPSRVSVADLDGDGKMDVIATHKQLQYDETALIFRNTSSGNGSISFSQSTSFILQGGSKISFADLNLDNKIDLAYTVSQGSTSIIRIQLNTSSSPGQISFAPQDVMTSGVSLSTAVIGDLDGDGKEDLISGNGQDVYFLRNTSNPGTLSFAPLTVFPNLFVLPIETGDINGDGKKDVVARNLYSGSFISVLKNTTNSAVNLTPSQNFAVGGNTNQGSPTTLLVADLDNNGKLDIVNGFSSPFIGTISVLLNQQCVSSSNTTFDFDGDGKADQAVFRSTNQVWYLLRSQSGFTAAQFGISTDKITPADFDGDGRTDIAVFRDGVWYLLRSQLGFTAIQFGQAGDVPVPADYDGDGKADVAVYRNGVWYILQSQLGFTAFQFGISTDKPVPADFDADGKTDAAVYRDGVWYMLRSLQGFTAIQFGIASDKPTVGDYDGDGRADQAVYRSGVWYILGSTQGFFATQFGVASDIPVAADYDGDGKTDVAVFRDGVWYLLRSQQGFGAVQFGTTNDRPIPAAFVP